MVKATADETPVWQYRLVGIFMLCSGLLLILTNGYWWGAAAGICIGLGIYRVLGRRGF